MTRDRWNKYGNSQADWECLHIEAAVGDKCPDCGWRLLTLEEGLAIMERERDRERARRAAKRGRP